MAGSDQLFPPGSDEYEAGTKPNNTAVTQRPAFVACPRNADDVASVVKQAAQRGLTVLPQATGHGAGGDIGPDTVLIDTSGLTALVIDADTRVATAGAGLTWGQINPKAGEHGLLGLAGSSPGVAIGGYTFGGGLGWLIRPYGMASGSLRRVEYVNGRGEVRNATDDAGDDVDREAIWTFRGGGGVGIATTLEFDLFAVPELYAGYLLWPIDQLDAVVAAWADSMAEIGEDVASCIAVLHAPPAPPFPDELQGTPIVHLSLAANHGEAGARPLLDRVRAAAKPVVDTWGPADADKLGQIHLDPPEPGPGAGDAWWLTDQAPTVARDLLATIAPADSAATMLEIRSVGNHAEARDGAETTVPGPYLYHVVGDPTGPSGRQGLDDIAASLRTIAEPAATGRQLGSWIDGVDSVPDALPARERDRAAAAAQLVDPDGVIARTRYVR